MSFLHIIQKQLSIFIAEGSSGDSCMRLDVSSNLIRSSSMELTSQLEETDTEPEKSLAASYPGTNMYNISYLHYRLYVVTNLGMFVSHWIESDWHGIECQNNWMRWMRLDSGVHPINLSEESLPWKNEICYLKLPQSSMFPYPVLMITSTDCIYSAEILNFSSKVLNELEKVTHKRLFGFFKHSIKLTFWTVDTLWDYCPLS